MRSPEPSSKPGRVTRAALLTTALVCLAACGSSPSAPADGGGVLLDGGAVDGGAVDGGVVADGGARETLTLELLGQRAFAYLRANSFADYRGTVAATAADVRAACPGRAGLDTYFISGEGSATTQQAAFTECRSKLDFSQAALQGVRTIPSQPLLRQPECPVAVSQSQVLVDVLVGGAPFVFVIGEALELGGSWRAYSALSGCGPSLVDGGAGAPTVTVTVDPDPGRIGQAAQFTAALSGGAPPYTSCTWSFSAGTPTQVGTILGAQCTTSHVYTMEGDFVVVAKVVDSGSRLGQSASTYRVNPTGQGGLPDLIIRQDSVSLVNPPTQHRYPQGGQVQIAFTVKNIGTKDVGASVVRLTLRDPVTRATTDVADINVPALASLAEVALTPTFTIPANQATEVYDLLITADGPGVVEELLEGNNLYVFLWITVI